MEIRENFESEEENSIDNAQEINQEEEANANLSEEENIIDFENNFGEERVIKYNPNDYKIEDIIEKLM